MARAILVVFEKNCSWLFILNYAGNHNMWLSNNEVDREVFNWPVLSRLDWIKHQIEADAKENNLHSSALASIWCWFQSICENMKLVYLL